MDKQIIIAFSGRKNAGKNTIASFVSNYFAKEYLLNTGHSKTSVLYERDDPRIIRSLAEDHVLECSFADNLKEFCIDTLGLTYEQCYGTDEQKNSPTEYKWETAPQFLRWKFGDAHAKAMIAKGKTQDELLDIYIRNSGYIHYWEKNPYRGEHQRPGIVDFASDQMSGREIMQIVGTDLMRQTFGNIWAAATIRRIKKQGKKLSLITDNRFPNEIAAVLEEPHGYIVRLTRSPFGTADAHPSESSLDDYDWNRDKCFVLDNSKMSIEEQNEAVKPIVDKIFHFAGEK